MINFRLEERENRSFWMNVIAPFIAVFIALLI